MVRAIAGNLRTKFEENIFKKNNQINSSVTTRTWVLPTEWTKTRPSTGLVSELKNGGGPGLFKCRCCFPGCVDIVSH